MPKPLFISIPRERPHCCAECPLLGKRPQPLPKGEKYTLMCFLTGHRKMVTGRGSHQPDARFRCKPKEYDKVFRTYNGDIEVSAMDYERYRLFETAWLYERDKRIFLENEQTT